VTEPPAAQQTGARFLIGAAWLGAAAASLCFCVNLLFVEDRAALWTDVMAIPKDAPHPDAAHAFIAYLLEPEVIAAVSNYVFYANPNQAAEQYLDPELRNDPGIYPPPAAKARLFVPPERSDREIRDLNRRWTRIKAQR